MTNIPNFEKPFHLAKWVAQQLSDHPEGISARGLYQLYLPQFSEFNVDGSAGATMIQQHLRKMEDEGLAVADKPAKKGLPTIWRYTGARLDAVGVDDSRTKLINPGPYCNVPLAVINTRAPSLYGRGEEFQKTAVPEPGPVAFNDDAIDDGNMVPDETTSPYEADNEFDGMVREFAQACREFGARNRPRIEDVDAKLDVLDRLRGNGVLAPEISSVLDAIRDDIGALSD